MQKEKTSEWSQPMAPMVTLTVLTALTTLLLAPPHAARAEETTPQPEAASGMDQNATVGDMIRLAKQAGEREFAARLNPARKPAGKEGAAVDTVVDTNPVLLALYGTDRNYKAELDVNGQSRVVPVPGPLQKMGRWKYIALMEDGVLLSKQAQDSNLPAGSKAGDASHGKTVLACQQKETCLFLSVPKSAGDSRSPVTPDAQARLLLNQLPGASRAPALEFGGKPQPANDRGNTGSAVAASRR
ncbi:hypothetical protein EJD96_14320 [Herbaspirillum seropedicae]|uniref:hypothetical protein n=1 Tax=Herbaspirillum seropedicae TaxID=964 RepID=UPI00111F71BA|nr:hypothetical protein [Herbaspirillum seropedicae]QDD65249.1 hypothetical protein EJD96_14320 [Herbaspirillum seropedicae]